MEITGKDLYKTYSDHLLDEWNIEVDKWENLEESVQSAWNTVAITIYGH